MADENLPATQLNGELSQVGADLPDRAFGSESITDNLPASIYATVGGLANSLTDEQVVELEAPTPEDEVDIRPDDGAVYVSHEYVRRKLNKTFGFFGWTMLQATPLKSRDRGGKTEWFAKYVLTINGVFVAQAIASRVLENNPRISLDDVAEMIESNCVVRCCKKIGIALEPWNRRWRDEWRKKWAVAVVAKNWQGNRVKMWRRKDADPLDGEIGPYTEEKQPQRSAHPAPGGREPEQASTSPAPSAKVAGGAADGAGWAVESPKAPEPKASPPAPPAAPAPTGKGPFISQGQVNLVLARARAAGLIVEDDPTTLMDILERGGMELSQNPGGLPMENCVTTIKRIPMKALNVVLKAIDSQRSEEPAERI